jgi:hypothetical protein
MRVPDAVCTALTVLFATPAWAQVSAEPPALTLEQGAAPAPEYTVGDSWVFDQTVEKGPTGFAQVRLDLAIERLDGETMIVGLKRDGAPVAFEDHVVGADWSQRELADGQEMVTTRPFTVPLTVGQSWTVDYVDSTRRGGQISNHVHRTYRAVGWRDVTVPAGAFRAIEVQADGIDDATVEVPAAAVGGAFASSTGTTSVSHAQRGGQGHVIRKTHDELYYVPQIKNYVKSIEEQYNTDEVQIFSKTRVLVAFKPAS